MFNLFKIYDVKNKNKNGYGNGIGDLIHEVNNYNEIGLFMKNNNLNQVFVIDKSNLVYTFLKEDFE